MRRISSVERCHGSCGCIKGTKERSPISTGHSHLSSHGVWSFLSPLRQCWAQSQWGRLATVWTCCSLCQEVFTRLFSFRHCGSLGKEVEWNQACPSERYYSLGTVWKFRNGVRSYHKDAELAIIARKTTHLAMCGAVGFNKLRPLLPYMFWKFYRSLGRRKIYYPTFQSYLFFF